MPSRRQKMQRAIRRANILPAKSVTLKFISTSYGFFDGFSFNQVFQSNTYFVGFRSNNGVDGHIVFGGFAIAQIAMIQQ